MFMPRLSDSIQWTVQDLIWMASSIFYIHVSKSCRDIFIPRFIISCLDYVFFTDSELFYQTSTGTTTAGSGELLYEYVCNPVESTFVFHFEYFNGVMRLLNPIDLQYNIVYLFLSNANVIDD
jgi:hypothetical protein